VTFQKSPRTLPLQWAVCDFHDAAIAAGEPYSLSDDQQELLLGPDSPLEIVHYQVHQDAVSEPRITLVLGHDGIETERVTFQMKAEDARAICFWVAGGPHQVNGELPDPVD